MYPTGREIFNYHYENNFEKFQEPLIEKLLFESLKKDLSIPEIRDKYPLNDLEKFINQGSNLYYTNSDIGQNAHICMIESIRLKDHAKKKAFSFLAALGHGYYECAISYLSGNSSAFSSIIYYASTDPLLKPIIFLRIYTTLKTRKDPRCSDWAGRSIDALDEIYDDPEKTFFTKYDYLIGDYLYFSDTYIKDPPKILQLFKTPKRSKM